MLINALPIHIFHLILSHVDYAWIWSAHQVCKRWHSILKSQEYWATRIGYKFGDTAIPQFHAFCTEFGRNRNTFQAMYGLFFSWREKICTFTAYFPPGFFNDLLQKLPVQKELPFHVYLDGRRVAVGHCKLRKLENNAYTLYVYCSSGEIVSNDTIKQRLLHADAIVTPGWWGNIVESFHIIHQGGAELQPDLGVPIQAIAWYK